MEKLKRFLDVFIPTENCNFRCHYCYIAQKREFNTKIAAFDYSDDFFKKAFSKERFGGTCLVNLCAGGETLLSKDVLRVTKCILEAGHYVMLVTNGTPSENFKVISSWDSELLKRLFFKFSFHYLELKRLNLFDKFYENIMLMKNSGCSYTIEITPSDELVPYIDEIKQYSLEKFGALPHITIARDDRTNGIDVLSSYSWEEYKKIWSVFNSQLFDFKTRLFYVKRKEFCYAGDWSLYINMGNGNITKCYCEKSIGNFFRDLDKKIDFKAVGSHCSIAHCYNGHAFLSLGVIPELNTPSFASLRDKNCTDGSQWLNPQFREFISQKLYDNNNEYSKFKKILTNQEGYSFKERIAEIPYAQAMYRKLTHKDK